MGLFDFFNKKKKTEKSTEQENRLFWAPAIYEGDPLVLPEPDYDIHVFPGAAKMITRGVKIRSDGPLPSNYQLAQKSSGRRMHLRTIRNPKLGSKEMVPLFTDPGLLLQIYTPNTRISIVDYQTARRFCLQDRAVCSGIVINPGRDNRMITIEQLDQE